MNPPKSFACRLAQEVQPVALVLSCAIEATSLLPEIVTLFDAAVAPREANPVPLIVSRSTLPVTVRTETLDPLRVRDSRSVLFVTAIDPSTVAPVARVLM